MSTIFHVKTYADIAPDLTTLPKIACMPQDADSAMQYMYCLRRGNLISAEGFPAESCDIADLTYLSQSQRDRIKSTWEEVATRSRSDSIPRFQGWAETKSNKCVFGPWSTETRLIGTWALGLHARTAGRDADHVSRGKWRMDRSSFCLASLMRRMERSSTTSEAKSDIYCDHGISSGRDVS